jgi:hypothetical protein
MNLKRLFNHISKFKDIIEYDDYGFNTFKIVTYEPETIYVGITIGYLKYEDTEYMLTITNRRYITYLKVINKKRKKEILILL